MATNGRFVHLLIRKGDMMRFCKTLRDHNDGEFTALEPSQKYLFRAGLELVEFRVVSRVRQFVHFRRVKPRVLLRVASLVRLPVIVDQHAADRSLFLFTHFLNEFVTDFKVCFLLPFSFCGCRLECVRPNFVSRKISAAFFPEI